MGIQNRTQLHRSTKTSIQETKRRGSAKVPNVPQTNGKQHKGENGTKYDNTLAK